MFKKVSVQSFKFKVTLFVFWFWWIVHNSCRYLTWKKILLLLPGITNQHCPFWHAVLKCPYYALIPSGVWFCEYRLSEVTILFHVFSYILCIFQVLGLTCPRLLFQGLHRHTAMNPKGDKVSQLCSALLVFHARTEDAMSSQTWQWCGHVICQSCYQRCWELSTWLHPINKTSSFSVWLLEVVISQPLSI